MSNEPGARRLLLVEDDDHVARSLVRTLTSIGYGDIVHMASGEAAIACLQGRSFEVVLSDLRLGAASGLDVLAAARASDPHVALVLMSGSPTHASVSAAQEIGVVAFLAKPIARRELEATLQRAACSHDHLAELDLRSRRSAHSPSVRARSTVIARPPSAAVTPTT